MNKKNENDSLLCSFSGKNQKEVKKLIAGTTVFVCVGGCQSEFENVNEGEDGNEIMCPHCGLIGDSPL